MTAAAYAQERVTRTPITIGQDLAEIDKALQALPEPFEEAKARQIKNAVEVEFALGKTTITRVQEAHKALTDAVNANENVRPALNGKRAQLQRELDQYNHLERQHRINDAKQIFATEFNHYKRLCKELHAQYKKLSNMTFSDGVDISSDEWNGGHQRELNLPPLNPPGYMGTTGTFGKDWEPR